MAKTQTQREVTAAQEAVRKAREALARHPNSQALKNAFARAAKIYTATKQANEKAMNTAATTNVLGADNMRAAEQVMNSLVPKGSFGKVSTGVQTNPDGTPQVDANGNPVRIQENADVLNRYQDLSHGMSAQEYQASREQAQAGLSSSLATRLGQLTKAQARGKVYGAAAGAQQSGAINEAENQRMNLEQQNMLKDMEMKRTGLDKYASSLAGFQTYERAGQQYNLGQDAAEQAARAGAYTNTIGLGQAKNYTDQELAIARQQVESQNGATEEPEVLPAGMQPGSAEATAYLNKQKSDKEAATETAAMKQARAAIARRRRTAAQQAASRRQASQAATA